MLIARQKFRSCMIGHYNRSCHIIMCNTCKRWGLIYSCTMRTVPMSCHVTCVTACAVTSCAHHVAHSTLHTTPNLHQESSSAEGSTPSPTPTSTPNFTFDSSAHTEDSPAWFIKRRSDFEHDPGPIPEFSVQDLNETSFLLTSEDNGECH